MITKLIEQSIANKKKLNKLLDQLLEMEQKRQALGSEEESVKMVSSWTNTDPELVYTLFEKYRIGNGDTIKVDSYS